MRFEISWVFAFSPRYLLLGPKPTSDGVARLEVSLVICDFVSRRLDATIAGATYDIDAFVSGDTNLGGLTTQVYSND